MPAPRPDNIPEMVSTEEERNALRTELNELTMSWACGQAKHRELREEVRHALYVTSIRLAEQCEDAAQDHSSEKVQRSYSKSQINK